MKISTNAEADKLIRRMPFKNQIQARAAIDYYCRDVMTITADTFVMAALLTLIEDFGFGTSENSTRLFRFKEKMQRIVDENADKFDDAVAEGLKNRLHNLGVEYERG